MEKKTLKIYFTSDTHGYVFPTDYRSAEECDIGLFKCVNQFHKDGNTLFIDGGDVLQGWSCRCVRFVTTPLERPANLQKS